MDTVLIKTLVKHAVIGLIIGILGPAVGERFGIPPPVGLLLTLGGYLVWAYSATKKEEEEANAKVAAKCEEIIEQEVERRCIIQDAERRLKEREG